MHYCQQGAVKPNVYVVTCKKCTRSIPAGTQEFPRGNLVVQCPLCGELRRYRPSEVYVWSVARLQAISFDGRSGLLLCIRLLGEAMDLLRAMMESAPALS